MKATASWWVLGLIGLAAGAIGGGLGVGGGIVIVPLLVFLGLGQHRAHATSLAAMLLIAAVGTATFATRGYVDLRAGLLIGLGGVAGSMVGAALMNRMSTRALSLAFAVVLIIAGIRMIFGGEPAPEPAGTAGLGMMAAAVGIGLLAGCFSGITGIGAGIIIIPSVILIFGLAQHSAQGTSLLAISLIALGGTAVNLRNRRVAVIDALLVGVGGAVGALVGSQIAFLLEGRALAVGFGVLALLVGGRALLTQRRAESTELDPVAT